MHFDWIASPVTLYAILAAALLTALVLFVSMKCEIEAARRLALEAGEAVNVARSSLAEELAIIRATGPAPAPLETPAAAGECLNLTRRAAALRMDRRGEGVSTIAAALRVSQNEVELLLKLQKLTNQASHSTTA
jgi:hypothetical protein